MTSNPAKNPRRNINHLNMKSKDQVVSLELAKRLRELKVIQESYFYFLDVSSHDDEKGSYSEIVLRNRNEKSNRCEQWSAFTVAELGEMLPSGRVSISKQIESNGHGGMFSTWRIDMYAGENKKVIDDEYTSEANARAEAIIWLIENGHITP